MNKCICQLVFCSLVSPCLADGVGISQDKPNEPTCIASADGDQIYDEKIDELLPKDLPIGSRDVWLEASFILFDLYYSDPDKKGDIKSDPKPLIDYLNTLRVKIEKQQKDIDALDVKIANKEGNSRDLVRKRSEISADMALQKDIYDELNEYLQNKTEWQEPRCSSPSK